VRYISHELRTPLNTAFLGLKLLSSDLKASKSQKDAERYDTLVDVNMSCTAAVDILNDLLCYEKLESGILELHKENIAVSTFLRDSLLPFSVQARESGVIVTVETNRADVTPSPSHSGYFRSVPLQSHDVIFADKFKMDQVIRNLMSNALKSTPRGGHVTIKASFVHDNRPDQNTVSLRDRFGLGTRKGSRTSNLRSHRNPGAVYTDDTLSATPALTPGPIRGTLVIVMTDTGAGISKGNQARLFNEIVQFSPEKLQAGGGSGLGLWITQEILNLHDGSISVSSEGEGMGSTFTIEMPMIRRPVTVSLPAEPKAPKIQSTETAQESNIGLGSLSAPQSTVGEVVDAPPGRQSYTVLIVDDSCLNRKMLLKCLRADGHTCFEAEDGLEAIAMVKERISHASGGCGRPYDAILMDFVMPNMDGPTATQEIRALGYTAPIFGVTGNGE
jgi:signal transduction histidine kinase